MKINTIHSNKILYKNNVLPNNTMSFNGFDFDDIKKVKKIISKDADKIFDEKVSKIITKVDEQINPYNADKLDNAVRTVRKQVPNTGNEEVLTVMQRLTQWANYSCLPTLEEILNNKNVYTLAIDSSYMKYSPFHRIIKYIGGFKKAINFLPENRNEATFFTTSDASYLSTKLHIQEENFTLEGFDAGINFLTSETQLESKTAKVLRKILHMRKQNPQISFYAALCKVLNDETINTFDKLKINNHIISNNNQPTVENILNQLNPLAPKSSAQIKKIIETISEHFSRGDKVENIILRNNIAHYLSDKIALFPKESIISMLKNMQGQISEFITENNLPAQNVYYLIPRLGSSHNVILEMYNRINKIQSSRIIIDESASAIKNLNERLPKNSTIVVLDDYAGSGESMLDDFCYLMTSENLDRDKHILFCPLVVEDSAIDNINFGILRRKREELDKLLFVKILKNKTQEYENYFFETAIGSEAIGYTGYTWNSGKSSALGGCTIFPYMAPDNNTGLSTYFARAFFSRSGPIKTRPGDFWDIELALKEKNLVPHTLKKD